MLASFDRCVPGLPKHTRDDGDAQAHVTEWRETVMTAVYVPKKYDEQQYFNPRSSYCKLSARDLYKPNQDVR